jgi:hypothetical protein
VRAPFCGWLSVAAGLIELGRYVLALGIVIAAITYLSNWIDRRRPALVGGNSASGEDDRVRVATVRRRQGSLDTPARQRPSRVKR